MPRGSHIFLTHTDDASKYLGAAKTSAYYAIAPFIGAFLSFIILKEALTPSYAIAFLLMVIGSVIATKDSLG